MLVKWSQGMFTNMLNTKSALFISISSVSLLLSSYGLSHYTLSTAIT